MNAETVVVAGMVVLLVVGVISPALWLARAARARKRRAAARPEAPLVVASAPKPIGALSPRLAPALPFNDPGAERPLSPAVPSELKVTPSLHGARAAKKPAAPASEPSQRLTEVAGSLEMFQVLNRPRFPMLALKRKTPPPPPVATGELPAPVRKVAVPFFTQPTREDIVPQELLQRSVPPMGAITDEHDAPARQQPRVTPARTVSVGDTTIEMVPRASAEKTREVVVPPVVRPFGTALTAETPAPRHRSIRVATPPKSARIATPIAGLRAASSPKS